MRHGNRPNHSKLGIVLTERAILVVFLGTSAGLYVVVITTVGVRVITGVVFPVNHTIHLGMRGCGPADIGEVDQDDKPSRCDVERVSRVHLSRSLCCLIINVGSEILSALSVLDHLLQFVRFAIFRQLLDPARVGRYGPNSQRNQTTCQKSTEMFFH